MELELEWTEKKVTLYLNCHVYIILYVCQICTTLRVVGHCDLFSFYNLGQ